MLAVFCLRLACGMTACLLLLPPALVNPRFYRTHFLTALGLACVALLSVRDSAGWPLLGLLAGGAVVALRRRFGERIRTSEQLSKSTGLPVLAALSDSLHPGEVTILPPLSTDGRGYARRPHRAAHARVRLRRGHQPH